MIKQTFKLIDRGLVGRLKTAHTIYHKETRDFFEIVLAYILNLVKLLTPTGATKLLRSGMYSDIYGRPANLKGKVASGAVTAHYAEAVEEGSKPHSAPVEGLELWARRKFGESYPGEALDIAWAVRGMIKKWGTKGQFMFKKALARSRGFIAINKQALAQKIASKIERG
jgi:hypothetical protein